METFGYKPGQTLNRFSGQNEFLSALHSLEAGRGLSDAAKVTVISRHDSLGAAEETRTIASSVS